MTAGRRDAVTPALLLLLLATAAGANEAGFCLQGAHNLRHSSSSSFEQEAGGRGSRAMPPAAPALAAFDWPLPRPANHTQLVTHYTPCHGAEAPFFRFRAVSSAAAGGPAIYVDHDHARDGRYRPYRQAFLEQLMLAMWLYKDFPDVDLVVDFADHPQLCDQDIPFLRYAVFNASLLPAHQTYNLTELLAPAWVSPAYYAATQHHSSGDQPQPQHTRGFTMPSPEAWRDLSLTQEQLQDFVACMDNTHPWAAKRPVVFWRGQATGCSRGWPQAAATPSLRAAAAAAEAGTRGSPPPQPEVVPPTAAAAAAAAGRQPHLLRNKRVQAVLRLFPYPEADVGITLLPQLTPECLGGQPRTGAAGEAARPGSAAAAAPDGLLLGGAGGDGQQGALLRRRRRRGRAAQRRHTRRQPSGRAPLTWHGGGGGSGSGSGGGGIGAGRRLAALAPWRRQRQHVNASVGAAFEAGGSSSITFDDGGGGSGQRDSDGGGTAVPRARAYRALVSLLHKEGIGLEGWADAAVTLSLDGYGPPFRLPQQLLLGSPVLKMASPYQQWLDPHLLPRRHFTQFRYDLSDLEHQVMTVTAQAAAGLEGGTGGGAEGLRGMAAAARAAVLDRVHIVAQLDAFAWAVGRYKDVCAWRVEAPATGDPTWRLLQLPDAGDVFGSQGVPETVQVQVMQHLRANFEQALARPAFAGAAMTRGDGPAGAAGTSVQQPAGGAGGA